MKKIELPSEYNYIGLFLTLGCNLSCSYCINHITGKAKHRSLLSGEQWIEFINRLDLRDDLPVTLQGGEPSTHPHFFQILKGIRSDLKIDILTNLQFNPDKLIEAVTPARLNRNAPYAPIRVSFHPETMDLSVVLEKISYLQNKGYEIGLFSVAHPKNMDAIESAKRASELKGIDFRVKDFLGEYNGKIYGSYKYENAVASKYLKSCICKTSELLVSPSGDVHRCHHDLYNNILPVGSILNDGFGIRNDFIPCRFYGNCNPCDVKIKNSRFQVYGHTSVEIKDIDGRVVDTCNSSVSSI